MQTEATRCTDSLTGRVEQLKIGIRSGNTGYRLTGINNIDTELSVSTSLAFIFTRPESNRDTLGCNRMRNSNIRLTNLHQFCDVIISPLTWLLKGYFQQPRKNHSMKNWHQPVISMLFLIRKWPLSAFLSSLTFNLTPSLRLSVCLFVFV